MKRLGSSEESIFGSTSLVIALGFGVDSGKLLVLYGPGRSNVLDTVVAKKDLRGRYPDGICRWLFPVQPTPGVSNAFVFHDEIVINEIMYHARDLTPLAVGGPWRESLESWVELHNRSPQVVDLTGWRLDEGIDYHFTPGTTIRPAGATAHTNAPTLLPTLLPAVAACSRPGGHFWPLLGQLPPPGKEWNVVAQAL